MPRSRCRKCGNNKVSAPKVGTFVGDMKNFRKTTLGQRSTQTVEPESPVPPFHESLVDASSSESIG